MSPVLRASLAFLLLAVTVYGQGGPDTFRVTASNSLLSVFMDGIQMTPLPNATDWRSVDEVAMHHHTRLVAIRGSNLLGAGCSGIMAAATNPLRSLVTDGSWKCTTALLAGNGWQQLGYDDRSWPPATEHLRNGEILTGCGWFVLPALPTTAYWIWTDRFQDGDLTVSCRGYTDVCDEMPCQNGGTCNQNEPKFCTCPVRWGGTFCELPINECVSNPCGNNGVCELNDEGYVCKCDEGYSGTHCEIDISDCSSAPCQNGATCNFEIDGGYTCSCVPGYTGLDCETNIDECSPDPCLNGGSCEDGINEATCKCLPGYDGQFCQNDINECDPNPCLSAGLCEDLVNGFRCTCHTGWSGNRCETPIGECATHPCQNGGTCTLDGPGGEVDCLCTPGWSGPFCTSDIDDCESMPCKNGGRCIDGDDKYTCHCEPEWEGTNCQYIKANCGSIMAQSGFPATNAFTILCEIDVVNHGPYVNTTCNNLIKGINYYDDADGIMRAGGTYGCYATKFYNETSGACVPNYNPQGTLGSCLSCTHMGVCLRIPNEPKKSLAKKKIIV